MRDEPAMMQNGMPNPRTKRATTYIEAADCQLLVPQPGREIRIPFMENAWMKEPRTMTQLPPNIAHRRPKVSFTHGTNGSAKMAPRLYAADIIPSNAPLGSLKSK